MPWSYQWNYNQSPLYNQLERMREWMLEAGGAGAIVQGFSPLHPGLSLAFGQNSPVYALGSGTVEYAGGDPTTGQGTHVFLRLDNGWRIAYGYLSDLNQFSFSGGHQTPGENPGVATQAGQRVTPGQLLGHSNSNLYLSFVNAQGQVQNPGPSVARLVYNVFHPLGLGHEPLGQINLSTFTLPTSPVNPANVATTLEGTGSPVASSAGYGTPIDTRCPDGGVWNPTTHTCEQPGSPYALQTPTLPGLPDLGALWQGITAQFADAGGAIALAFVGGVLIIAGIFALARGSATVQTVAHTAEKEAVVAA